MGGVPINRRERTSRIGQLVNALASSTSVHIAITPEGARTKTDHWKSGFHRLTLETGVAVALGFFDYRNKRVGVERWVMFSGDEEIDFAMLDEYYADKTACYPKCRRHPLPASGRRRRSVTPAPALSSRAASGSV